MFSGVLFQYLDCKISIVDDDHCLAQGRDGAQGAYEKEKRSVIILRARLYHTP
jgi:hypothetical protein